MATHSSILAWRIAWTRGVCPWGQIEPDTTEATLHMHTDCSKAALSLYIPIRVPYSLLSCQHLRDLFYSYVSGCKVISDCVYIYKIYLLWASLVAQTR